MPPKRNPRTTAEQMTALIHFISEHKLMLSGKCHPLQIKEIVNLWDNLGALLNNIKGARKDTDEWKRFFIEWKSKTRKKARDLKLQQTGTGGGECSVGILSDNEERLMGLLGWVSVEGNSNLPPEIEPEDNPLEEVVNVEPVLAIVEDPCSDFNEKPQANSSSSSQNKKKKKQPKTASNMLQQSALEYTKGAEILSNAICKFASAIDNLATSINNYAAATEKLAESNKKE